MYTKNKKIKNLHKKIIHFERKKKKKHLFKIYWLIRINLSLLYVLFMFIHGSKFSFFKRKMEKKMV